MSRKIGYKKKISFLVVFLFIGLTTASNVAFATETKENNIQTLTFSQSFSTISQG